jgi:two-component system OmpR family sensor kinase
VFKNLYTKLAAVLLGLFLLVGALSLWLTLSTTRIYFQEVNQKLNRILARHLVSEQILMKDGRANEQALKDVFHMLMVVNPLIEVYLVDQDGKILSYSAPPGKVKRTSISLGPVKELLANTSALPVLGDDPRDPSGRKVFSAAPILHNGRIQGYLYIILGGEEFETEARMLQGSYIVRLSMGAVAAGLVFALMAALLLFNRMTRPLRDLAASMETFRKSDFSVSPGSLLSPARSNDEIGRIGTIFNEMAGRIVSQIRMLKDADRLRREFTATIAHDLRTPLTSLQGYLETLQIKEGQLSDEEKKEYLETAVKRSDQLGRLIVSVFELAKLEALDFRARFESFSLAELVQDILQKFRLTAETKKVGLRTDIADDLPRVHADIGLIERVFQNLLDNALRYTPEGGTISVSASARNERIAITVSDTGAGIPQENLPHLFDHERRRPRDDGHTGSGLGLIITKQILELHGSGIEVRSAPGTGASFTFTLPILTPKA